MKTKIYTGISILTWMFSTLVNAQESKDTTRLNLGETEVLIINTKKGKMIVDGEKLDTIDASPKKNKHFNDDNEGHWGGIDFGVSMLLNSNMKSSFPSDPFLENDPGKSFYWNINLKDHRFNIYKQYVGITTGFGINFTQVGIKNNKILTNSSDSLYLIQDTINSYSKNKLRGTYLQIPLLLEFNTNADEEKSFYFATGVIGGVRVGSALIQKIDRENFDNKQKTKGDFALKPFKVDATVRMGYGDWGLFANYALMPLFDTNKIAEAYPLTFGVTLNF